MIFKNSAPAAAFTVMGNDTIRDPLLSFTARGLLATLLSRPHDWTVRMTELYATGPNYRGKVSDIRRAVGELTAAGYMRRQRVSAGRNSITWVVEVTNQPGVFETGVFDSAIYRSSKTSMIDKGGDIQRQDKDTKERKRKSIITEAGAEETEETGKARELKPEELELVAMVNALSDVTGISAHALWDEVSRAAEELIAMGVTPDEIARSYGTADPGARVFWWYRDSPRGAIHKGIPTLTGILRLGKAPKIMARVAVIPAPATTLASAKLATQDERLKQLEKLLQ